MLVLDHIEPSNDPNEAENRASKLFMYGCLEMLNMILKRLALTPQVALRYFLKNNSVSL